MNEAFEQWWAVEGPFIETTMLAPLPPKEVAKRAWEASRKDYKTKTYQRIYTPVAPPQSHGNGQ